MDSNASYDSFKLPALTIGDLQKRAPSVFATTPFCNTHYTNTMRLQPASQSSPHHPIPKLAVHGPAR